MLDEGIDSIYEHDATGGRRGRREQQRVVSACAKAVGSPGRKASESVRLQPLGAHELLFVSCRS
jgi:hypothetical protein